jgi:hypothetical protein
MNGRAGLGGLLAGCGLNGAGLALAGLGAERDKTSIPATISDGFGGLYYLLSFALLRLIPFPLIEINRFPCFLGFVP